MRAVLCRTAYSVYPLGVFAAVPFQNLWHVPVAACMAADDVSVCHVLAAGAVALSFACAGGACGTAWDHCGCYRRSAVVFTEQLFFVCGIGSSFMGAYLLAYVQMGNVWDLIRELFNPTVLYATSGGWFMEMICACRLQEMNLPCYSAVERLRSA